MLGDELSEEFVIEPIIGFRAWNITTIYGRLRLISPQQKTPWPARAELEAACASCADKKRAKCNCGINAFYDEHSVLVDNLYLLSLNSNSFDAWGEVKLMGDVIAYDHGYRASKAYPHRIILNADRFNEEQAQELAEEYGIEVVLDKKEIHDVAPFNYPDGGPLWPAISSMPLWLNLLSMATLVVVLSACLFLTTLAERDLITASDKQMIAAFEAGDEKLPLLTIGSEGIHAFWSLAALLLFFLLGALFLSQAVRIYTRFVTKNKTSPQKTTQRQVVITTTTLIAHAMLVAVVTAPVIISSGLQATPPLVSELKMNEQYAQATAGLLTKAQLNGKNETLLLKEGTKVPWPKNDSVLCYQDNMRGCVMRKLNQKDLLNIAYLLELDQQRCATTTVDEKINADRYLQHLYDLKEDQRAKAISNRRLRACRLAGGGEIAIHDENFTISGETIL